MTNRQVLGYFFLACKELNLDKDIVKKISMSMYSLFDIKTEQEAETEGFEWYHSLSENE